MEDSIRPGIDLLAREWSMASSKYKVATAFALTRYWPWVIVFWIGLAIFLRWIAPPWDKIAQDGDLQFLPKNLPSRIGQVWLEKGFPNHKARSQLVLVLARRDAKFQGIDTIVGEDLARRFSHSTGVAAYRRFHQEDQDAVQLKSALQAFDDAIEMDEDWYEDIKRVVPDREDLLDRRLAIAYWDRAQVHEELGSADLAKADRETASLLDPKIAVAASMLDRSNFAWDGLLDVWTWKDPVLGSKLGANHQHARMLVLQSRNEFIATSNIGLIASTEKVLSEVREDYGDLVDEKLELGITGSAAVGGDMLRAAAASVQQTELVTVLLILVILSVVYRGPLLVAIPLASIGLSLFVSMSVIALLAVKPEAPSAYGIHVFTTTRIFLVVLLFGAGTDFCLFFIARCREALEKEPSANQTRARKLIAGSWMSVHDALLGSALTTIVGLGLMYFANFLKFSYTGPIIGLGLSITILVCLTFTPAVVCGLGRIAFWPSLPTTKEKGSDKDELTKTRWVRFWGWVAGGIIARPMSVLILCLIVLGIPALQGWFRGDWVTYDFAKELSPRSTSRQGSHMVEEFFGTQDSVSMTVVLAGKQEAKDEKQLKEELDRVRQRLYVPGVTSVRALTDPLGDFPPDKRMSLLAKDAWRRRLLENHRSTQQLYVSKSFEHGSCVARFDLLVQPSPFSADAEAILERVQREMKEEVDGKDSFWRGAEFACTGTTPGIHDLKIVTQADQKRIQILVTLGVWGVLIVMLRKVWISGYLILTVLLSYLTTLGLTLWFFQWAYGADFVGLDWKVPMFLFVILVAVGQDYNVYLTTRVYEEQAKFGPIQGLRRAMILTGGIITSCGVVMAGTFASMTSGAIFPALASLGLPAWLVGTDDAPMLRGIVELGFALSLGVLIDTLIVRSILVPAVFALLTRQGKMASA